MRRLDIADNTFAVNMYIRPLFIVGLAEWHTIRKLNEDKM